RSDKDQPLEDWFAYDTSAGNAPNDSHKPAARVHQRWGFAPLPPGEYAVTVRAEGAGSKEIPWGKVTVDTDKVAALKLDSGIELVVASKDAPPPKLWSVFD